MSPFVFFFGLFHWPSRFSVLLQLLLVPVPLSSVVKFTILTNFILGVKCVPIVQALPPSISRVLSSCTTVAAHQ